MTNKEIELFDEENNEIIEIPINKLIDNKIINDINKIKETNNEFKLKVIKFNNLIRVVEIVEL